MSTRTTTSKTQGKPAAARPVAPPRFLVHGIDTIQCAYYLLPEGEKRIDFVELRALRESLRDVRDPEPKPIPVGDMEFLLAPHGSRSGYPLVLSNRDFRIECGEFNVPSFYVTYSSEALWRNTAQVLHQRFLAWAEGVGYVPARTETLSRVDLCFDYLLPEMDFDEDSFVSVAQKDSQHRSNGSVQTFTFGRDDVVLRVYDKVAEIREQSGKAWMFAIWGEDHDVWRIEWQARKNVLRRFGIRTFGNLNDQAGDLLRYLATEHDRLCVKAADRNRARWPLHPLWRDLQKQIERFNAQGVYRVVDPKSAIEERAVRIGISVYGNLKQLAALRCVQQDEERMSHEEAQEELQALMRQVHDPFSWDAGVSKRIKFIRLGHD